MPKGCEGTAVATSSSSLSKFIAAEVLSFLEGRDSAQGKLCARMPGAMSKDSRNNQGAVRRCIRRHEANSKKNSLAKASESQVGGASGKSEGETTERAAR